MSFYYPDGEGGKKLIVMESTYSLPTASKTTKGGIKPGNALEMNNDTLNAIAMTGASSTAAGASGLVPAPAKGKQASFLRGDGVWAAPADTTYSTMKGASSTAAGTSGLVPAPAKVSRLHFFAATVFGQCRPITTRLIQSQRLLQTA